MAKILRLQDVGFTADFENARQTWLTASRTASKCVKLLSDISNLLFAPFKILFYCDQPRGLVVSVSDY